MRMQTLLNDSAVGSWRADGLPVTIAERTRWVYDRLAGIYPLSTFFFHSTAHRCALASSGIRDGMRVLEVATGSGEMFRRLVHANRRGLTCGVDLSPNMAAKTLRQVRKEFPSAATQCNAVDARHMPFRDASFDAVVCCYLLELLASEDILQTLNEFRRVLRPGGSLTLVLIGQNKGGFNRFYQLATWLAPAFWGRQVECWAADALSEYQFRVVNDRTVRQGFYPSRVLTARKERDPR
jgi:ubiquinone/menaquinone biosynthesis C-methylase UbiE